jgi:hypothetical protein
VRYEPRVEELLAAGAIIVGLTAGDREVGNRHECTVTVVMPDGTTAIVASQHDLVPYCVTAELH